MASAPPDKGQIAVAPDVNCELCEVIKITWKCLVCDELMCDTCKKLHLRSKFARNHKVVSLNETEPQRTRPKISLSSPIKCTHHPQEDIERYCEQCQLPVCIVCIAEGNHAGHPLSKINDIFETKGRELIEIVNVTTDKLSTFEDALNLLKQNQNDFSEKISQCIAEIKNRNKDLKEKIDKVTNTLVDQLQQMERKNQEQMKKTEEPLEKDLSSLKGLIEKCEDKLAKQEIEMIKFVADVKQRLDKYKPCDPPDPLNPPVFITRDVDLQQIETIFGNLQLPQQTAPSNEIEKTVHPDPTPSIDVKVISTLSITDKSLIAVVSDDLVWMATFSSKDISLVTANGDIKQTINTDFNVYDLAVTKSGDLLLTVHSGNKIKKLTTNNTFIDLYQAPTEYKTRGITVTDDDNIVVCLYSHDTKEGKLVRLSPSGQLLDTIQYNRDGKTPLFDGPWRVSCNRNGDLVVGQGNNKSVVVVDSTGCMRFTYKGQVQGLKEPFDPWYTVTDQYSHIIISDRDNFSLHILDKDGNFIQYIMTDKLGIQYPRGLSTDTAGRLWVCSYGSGKVVIVKYV